MAFLLRAAGFAELGEPAHDPVASPADSHALFHGSLEDYRGSDGRTPSCQTWPPGPISFFQIGTRAFKLSTISCAQRKACSRWGAPTATTRLASPTGSDPTRCITATSSTPW